MNVLQQISRIKLTGTIYPGVTTRPFKEHALSSVNDLPCVELPVSRIIFDLHAVITELIAATWTPLENGHRSLVPFFILFVSSRKWSRFIVTLRVPYSCRVNRSPGLHGEYRAWRSSLWSTILEIIRLSVIWINLSSSNWIKWKGSWKWIDRIEFRQIQWKNTSLSFLSSSIIALRNKLIRKKLKIKIFIYLKFRNLAEFSNQLSVSIKCIK